MFKLGLLVLALLPGLARANYLWQAWRFSPLDRWNWLYALSGLLLALLLLLTRGRREAGKADFGALTAVIPLALGVVLGYWRSINLLYFGAWVLLVWAAVWGLWGWRLSWRLLPAFLLLELALPTSALLSTPPACWNWTGWKLLAGGLLLAGGAAGCRCRRSPTRRTGLFLLALAVYGVLALAYRPEPPPGDDPGIPERLVELPGYLGTELPLSDFDRRFFSGSQGARRELYFGPGDAQIGMLTVESGDRVNEIHPAAVCLLSAGWAVESSRQRSLTLGDRVLALEELVASRDGMRYLFYLWYADGRESTGSYLRFRRSWRPGSRWTIRQLMIGCGDQPEEAAARLNDFIGQLAEAGKSGDHGKLH